MNPQRILDSNGQPFNKFSRAAWLRDILIEQTGRPWKIESVENGFIVESPQPAHSDTADFKAVSRESFDTVVFRPALRVLLPLQLPFLVVGLLLTLMAEDLIVSLLQTLHVSRLPAGFDVPSLAGWLQIGGLMIFGFSALGILVPWLSNSYVVGPEGIEQCRGILSRDSTSIRLADIRSITLKQGIIARLFNVGTLEFASAGTGGIDVRFTDVAAPGEIKRWIERLLNGHRDSGSE